MTKKNHILAFTFIILSAFFLGSCSKDTPQPEIEQEEPDRALLTFTKLDANGNETQTIVTVDFDELSHDHDHSSTATVSASEEEEHDHAHAHIHLDANSTYRLQIEMYRDGQMINNEFIKAADEHQFFFFAKDEESKPVSNFFNYVYEDKDQNSLPIGLKGKFSTLNAGQADIQVILSHGLDKTKVPAGVYNYDNYSLIGDTDMDQTFELHIEAK